MSQPDIATQRDTAVGTLPPTFMPTRQATEATQVGPAATGGCENLVWTELAYRGRTFELNRGLHIRVLKEDGGWAYESDDPELMGFGHTRAEAESSFCFGFAFNWDQIACEDDENLAQDAIDLKRALLTLVKSQG